MKYKGKHQIRYLFYAPGNSAPPPRFLKALCVEAGVFVQHSEDLTQKKGRAAPQSTPKEQAGSGQAEPTEKKQM